ncbi:MAG: AAA family ATPase, partial [Actinobacteria bacterium]|nr:AAA family ATPase [Actinomycetota bacterium]
LLSPNEVVSSDRLVDEIWGGRASEGALHTLRVTMSRLRKALGAAGGKDVVVTRAPGYVAVVGPGELDVARFDTLVARGRDEAAGGEHDQAAETFARALGLWRGAALADVADRFPFARLAADRLDEARLSALEDRIDADLACGGHRDILSELDTLTRTHPLRERLWGQSMLALYRAGRQAEALRAYQQLRRLLREELGIEPNATLQRLETAILRHEPALSLGTEPPGTAPLPLPGLLTDMGRIFVGRDEELKRLEEIWERSATGRVGVTLLSGEPGIGKTRLAGELATRVHAAGAVVLAGRCDENLGVPYQPFVEALRHAVDHAPAEALAGSVGRYGGELVRLVPEVADRIPDLAPPLRSDPETERYRLFDAVAAWLASMSADRPVLLLLDDLQWAARPTLMLLRHVARARSGRVLVLGIYRDTELTPDHPLVEVLADLHRQGGVDRLPLDGLDDEGVMALVEQASGRTLDEDGVALARAVHQETEGNPFFVREVLRHLAEIGAVARQEGVWTTRLALDRMGIPDGIREVVGERLHRLSGEANTTLRLAAVVGQEFELAVVQAAGALNEETLLGSVDEAVGARLVLEVSATRFRFAHALVRTTLYESLSGARKVALHRKVAEAIEAVHADALDDDLPTLAHHWANASPPGTDTSRAVEYARKAGDRALAQLAHDEAARYYASGLGLLDAGGAAPEDARRLELLIGWGEAQRRAGDPGYRQTLLDAAHLAGAIGDAPALARAALANTLGSMWTAFTVDTDRIEVLEGAIAAIGRKDPALRARLLATLGLELAWQPDPTRRVALSQEALQIARTLEDPATLAHVLLAREYTITDPENVAERFDATSELLEIAERLGDPVVASRALSTRFKVAIELADVAEAERSLLRNEALIGNLGQPGLTFFVLHHRASLAVLHGQPDAESLLGAADDLGRGIEQGGVLAAPEALSWSRLFWRRIEQGRVDEIAVYPRVVAERTAMPLFLRAVYAHILVEQGEPEAAAGLLDELAAGGFTHPRHTLAWLMFMVECSWTTARLGRADCVPALRSALLPYAGQLMIGGFAGWIGGSVSLYLAMLAATAGDHAQAAAEFGAAASTHERIGASGWLARTRVEWARMLLTRRQSGDTEGARELLSLARDGARELGLANIEGNAAALASTIEW